MLDSEKSPIEQPIPENIHEAFRHYRQIAIAMSVSLMGFSFTILGWFFIGDKISQNHWFLFPIIFYAITIIVGTAIQFCSYQGYKLQARTHFRQAEQKDADWWFKKEDEIVWILSFSFIFGVILTLLILSWPEIKNIVC